MKVRFRFTNGGSSRIVREMRSIPFSLGLACRRELLPNYEICHERMISIRLQGKPFNITVLQVYAPTSNAEETEVEQFYEDLQDPKKMSFSL